MLVHMDGTITVGLNAVIIAVTNEEPRILAIDGENDLPALPFGPLDPGSHRTLELGLRSWVQQQTGLDLGYVEQLYTFGDRDRKTPQGATGRVLSIAYLALVQETAVQKRSGISWQPVYDFIPWEDWRKGQPAVLKHGVVPALKQWVEAPLSLSLREAADQRLAITFGTDGAPWSGERVLERYELLYEAGRVAEASRDGATATSEIPVFGRSLASDHRRILTTALARLRGKIRYRPLVFELMAPTFTLLQLQQTVEALAGVRLHKQNFRRLVEKGGLVEETDNVERNTGGRPAKLFRFRHEVLRERSSPGVGLPGWRMDRST